MNKSIPEIKDVYFYFNRILIKFAGLNKNVYEVICPVAIIRASAE